MTELNGTITTTANPKPVIEPKPPINIGIDTDATLDRDLLDGADNGLVDLTVLQNFLQVAQNRESVYELIDTMSQDSMISAILETYAEDVCERSDTGQIIWVDAADEKIVNMVTYLLDTMNVQKHIYSWVYSLIKYGDLYLHLFKESDTEDDSLFTSEEVNKRQQLTESKDIATMLEGLEKAEAEKLKEDVIVRVHANGDHYTHYIEKENNPGEMFELTRYGKTMGYIKAPTLITPQNAEDMVNNQYWQYKVNQKDVTLYQATDYVHATLDDNSSRIPEEVTIFATEDELATGKDGLTYKVKRGQSLLANTFKTWRELALLQNAILLNRITKSSITRAIMMEIGDMPEEKVPQTMQRFKKLIEQKSSLKANEKMTEYTNPGAIENNIYIPVHNGQGAITVETIGGTDADVKNLADLDYFQNELFGALRIPKQFFGQTDDTAGFSGGESLSIISSRYGKAVKRIQDSMIQALTDAVNLMLLDKGLITYINNFTLKMTTPTTREELDRREAVSNQIRNIDDIVRILDPLIESQSIKLEILKNLLSPVIPDEDVLQLIQQQIDTYDDSGEEGSSGDEGEDDFGLGDDLGNDFARTSSIPMENEEEETFEEPTELETSTEVEVEEPAESEETLPTPAQAVGETEVAGESLEEDLPSFDALGINGLDL